jgi:nicotinate-nucleotide adenylyltransferase
LANAIPIHSKYRVIGLLGGSFNPAHEAHLYLSLYALKHLPLDEIWWLVSPQNPLKSPKSLAPYDKRIASAKAITKASPRIRVLDIEAQHHCYYTQQTVALLQRRFRGTHFVWLMGADNLSQFHHWRGWQMIARQIPLMVFDRLPHSHTVQRSKAYQKNRRFLIKNIGVDALKHAPSLGFFPMPRQKLSATQLRKMLGEKAFLMHNENAGH